MDNRQLRDLLDAAVGKPPHQVTVTAVRRRLTRRRVMDAVGVTAAVVIVAGLGVAAAVRVVGASPGPGAIARAGAPRYYVQQSFGGSKPAPVVVRATASGAVTATIRCPWPNGRIADYGIAATRNQSYFVFCEKMAKNGTKFVVTGSRIYRFQLTASGRIRGYSLVRGGELGQHRFEGIAASPDGSQIAVALGPATLGRLSRVPDRVFVINTLTGARAVWHGGAQVFRVTGLTFTNDGSGLEFVGLKRCAQIGGGLACEELRAVSFAAAGGQLDGSRLLLRLSTLARTPSEYIEPVTITTGGSTLTAAVQRRQNSPHSESIWVVEYSAATGRQLRVLYKMPTGNGFFYRFLSTDPTGRYLLFNAGPPSGTVNGWIGHGRLIPLKPANGSNILYETW